MKNSNTHLHELEIVKNTLPQFRFDGTCSFQFWQEKAAKKLEELLGLPLKKGDLLFEIEYEKRFDDYIDYRFVVESEPSYFVPCHLLVPIDDKEIHPLTICLSGHCGGMHLALGRAKNEKDVKSLSEWPHRAMGIRAVNDGRAALVVEARSFGECSINGYGTSCTETAKTAILVGRTLIGERVHDAICALDAVLTNFSIDKENIVVTGNSGGGTVSYYLAALDKRITACAPSCSICTFDGSIIAMQHCMCNHVPGIRKYFEMGDIAGLIAPRVLVIAAGQDDPIFPIDATKECYEMIHSLYSSAGYPDNSALVIGSGGHLNYADELWQKLNEFGL